MIYTHKDTKGNWHGGVCRGFAWDRVTKTCTIYFDDCAHSQEVTEGIVQFFSADLIVFFWDWSRP